MSGIAKTTGFVNIWSGGQGEDFRLEITDAANTIDLKNEPISPIYCRTVTALAWPQPDGAKSVLTLQEIYFSNGPMLPEAPSWTVRVTAPAGRVMDYFNRAGFCYGFPTLEQQGLAQGLVDAGKQWLRTVVHFDHF